MVRFLTLLFFVSQLAFGAAAGQNETDETINALSKKIFKEITTGAELNVRNNLAILRTKVAAAEKISEEDLNSKMDPFKTTLKPYEDFTSQNEVRFGDYVVSKTTAVCAGIVLFSAVLESLRFSQCTKGSGCEWVPPLFAATTGGNIASVVVAQWNNMYILGTVCLATFGLSLLQQGYEWHMPGFINPVTAFLSSVLLKKALLPDGSDIKVKGLSEYYSEVKPEMRRLLTEYLSTVAYLEKWDTKCKMDTPEHKKTAVQLYALTHFNDYHAGKNK